MWDYANKVFEPFPAEKKIIQKMISIGLSIRELDDEIKIFCDEIEIKPNSIARAYNVDRRVVINTLKRIKENKELYDFFTNLKPVADFSDSGSKMGFGVIEIIPDNAAKPGIISGVISVISKYNISIRQVITDDPDLIENPKAVVVTSTQLSGDIIREIKKVDGVKGVTVL
ncbi:MULTISPECIES: hypothetical protein [Acidiplasma]|jgi:predicted regulator of amino acid metabolism with ACT domain|uniref:Regulator n=3 Tax=Acidiplasma TaxID=507753 RepID=A0A0Q0RGJ0_9ARCH|nr:MULTISPECIES: hypothetical protein [Acidiplasma]KJE48644.1 regulator [Acidiplasma sp. MBA-1]KQB34240.1 regulator [Acidiplasma cupricumulans]KQB34647.1 regulator [Acidiplasma aeolicum]WMT55400.1 MAG: regulator [Acidiplasma sp.]